MISTQRFIALRVIRGYRTMSRATALVLFGTVLIDLVLVLEKRAIHKLWWGARDRAACAQWLREESLKVCQRRWETDVSVARWTRRIFLDIFSWSERLPGLFPSFYLIQLLTEHECFRNYWFNRGRANFPNSLWYPHALNNTIVILNTTSKHSSPFFYPSNT